MNLTTLTVGPIGTNCYIVYNEDAGTALVIDPGEEAERILALLEALKRKPAAILLTHGHFDHVGAVKKLAEKTGTPVYLHPADRELPPWLTRPLPETLPLSDGQILRFDGLELKVLHTPGHTPGGVCFRLEGEGVLFTGDSLFAGSCGRTDLGGSWAELAASLRRLAALDGNDTVYPGHGEPTDLDTERGSNPYLEMACKE